MGRRRGRAGHDLGIWADVLPVRQVIDEPVPAPLLRAGIPVPGHIAQRVTS